MTFWMKTLAILKRKGLKYLLKNLQIYEVIPIELFFDMKNLQKIVEVAHKTMLKILILMSVCF
jgi:hypothetical protein